MVSNKKLKLFAAQFVESLIHCTWIRSERPSFPSNSISCRKWSTFSFLLLSFLRGNFHFLSFPHLHLSPQQKKKKKEKKNLPAALFLFCFLLFLSFSIRSSFFSMLLSLFPFKMSLPLTFNSRSFVRP